MVSGHTMVGVRPLDKRFRSEALSLTSGEPAAPPPCSMALPLRPYRVDASSAQARSSYAGDLGTLLLLAHCSIITLQPAADHQTTCKWSMQLRRRQFKTGVIATACAAPQCWLLRTGPCCAAVSVERENCHAGLGTVMQASVAKCDLLCTSNTTPHACLSAASIVHFKDQFDAEVDCRRPCRSGGGQHGRWPRSMCLVCDLGSPYGAALLCPLELEGARSGLKTRVLTKSLLIRVSNRQ